MGRDRDRLGESEVLVRDAVGRGDQRVRGHDDVLGERAVPLGDAEHLLARAQVVAARRAQVARAARALRVDDDAVADDDVGDVRADLGDATTGLVAGDQRRDAERVGAAEGGQVGAAHPVEVTASRTSPGPGTGRGMSTTWAVPDVSNLMARIVEQLFPRDWEAALLCVRVRGDLPAPVPDVGRSAQQVE